MRIPQWILSTLLWFLSRFMRDHEHLYNKDGTKYMNRQRVIDEFHFNPKTKKYDKRRTLASRLLMLVSGGRWASIRLHHILLPDQDRDLHNHPFKYMTLILKGFYVEWVDEGEGTEFLVARAGGLYFGGGPTRWHRVATLPDDGTWTLFFMSPNTEEWGFKDGVSGKYISSATYFRKKGYRRDAQRRRNKEQ